MLGQLPNGIAAVKQDALVPVDIGQRAFAAGGRLVARIVSERAGIAEQLADIDELCALPLAQFTELERAAGKIDAIDKELEKSERKEENYDEQLFSGRGRAGRENDTRRQ